MELFRREALEARRGQWLGAVSLAQPLGLWLLTAAALLAASAVLLFLLLGTYTRRSTVSGQLVPTDGMAMVVAPATGVVVAVDVREGARVEAGQPLATVAVPRVTRQAGDTLAALEERLRRRREGLEAAYVAQRAQLSAQDAGLRNQLGAARQELAQVEAEIATRRAQVRLARETLHRLRQLQDDRYVSLLQIRQQESTALAQLAEVQALERQAVATRRLLVQLQQALDELPAQRDALEAGHLRDLAALEQEQVETRARGELVVSAPVGGIVSTQLAKTGQSLQAGQPLLSILPGEGRLEAELLVPSRAIGFIAPGDAVMLRYQAFPYQKFGHQRGIVTRISRSALRPDELVALLGSGQALEPFYRVTVAVPAQDIRAYGKAEALRPGMLLEADILGEERRLVEWLLEPLWTVRGRMAG
ncbi:HlyD family secretion protein [Pseudoxanthomonas suwonensis]